MGTLVVNTYPTLPYRSSSSIRHYVLVGVGVGWRVGRDLDLTRKSQQGIIRLPRSGSRRG